MDPSPRSPGSREDPGPSGPRRGVPGCPGLKRKKKSKKRGREALGWADKEVVEENGAVAQGLRGEWADVQGVGALCHGRDQFLIQLFHDSCPLRRLEAGMCLVQKFSLPLPSLSLPIRGTTSVSTHLVDKQWSCLLTTGLIATGAAMGILFWTFWRAHFVVVS